MAQVPYFTLSGPAAGKLWKAPGYADPILQFVADIQAGDSAHIAELTSVGDRLYFAADDDGDGVYEPWVSDGSTWGTVKLIDTGAGQRPKWFTKAGNYTYFAMGTESIWRTDGTPQGTHLSADVSASISDDEPVNWVYDNFCAIFFAGQDNVAGRELWSLDVSSGEAGLFRDLNPGSGSSSPNEFYMPDGLNVYFQALVDGYGRALYHYTFDGDSVTTFLANPPVTSPRSIKFRWGNHLSFIGDHPDYGAELFVIGSLPVSATAPGLETLTLRLEPNPAFSHTRLVLPESCRWQEGRLRLYDAMGGLRWESRPAGTTTPLPLGALPTGTYWVEYSEPSGRIGRVALVRN